MFQPDENCSTEDGIGIEPASNSKISMRSPSSNAIKERHKLVLRNDNVNVNECIYCHTQSQT